MSALDIPFYDYGFFFSQLTVLQGQMTYMEQELKVISNRLLL